MGETGDNKNNALILVCYTYSNKNSSQTVPPNVQRLVFVHPIRSLPNKLCYNHEHLQDLGLPSGLQHIGEQTFFGCQSLHEVELPLSIKAIYESAFEGCSSLVTVSSRGIIQGADDDVDTGLKTMKDHHQQQQQHSRSFGRLVLSKYTTTWRKMNGSANRDGVVGYRAFKGCVSLRTIVISTTMKFIKEQAFEDCQCLLDFNLTENSILVQIQSCAFKHCKSLQNIQIPSTVEVLGSYSFLRCNSLVNVTLAEGLKTIGNYAFTYCSSLQTIKVPSTVKTIAKGAFSFCESLVSVEFPDGFGAKIYQIAFKECSSLQRMTLPTTNKVLHSEILSNCRFLVEVILSEGLLEIGRSALRDCESLLSLVLPKSLKRIRAYAMSGCNNLVSVEIPRGSAVGLSHCCFQGCKVIANIALPPSTARLVNPVQEGRPFSGCSLLELQYDRIGHNISHCLERRFEKYPVHELCYYASSSTRAELKQHIQKFSNTTTRLSEDANHNDEKSITDQMGMTPFHVLLSASTKRLDLLEFLLVAYPATALLARDKNKKSALEYLISNWTVEARLMMKTCLQNCVLDPLQSWGLEEWGTHMSKVVDSMCSGGDSLIDSNLEAQLNEVVDSVTKYKKLEVTSLLEQWLWKVALLCTQSDGESEVERSVCRAKCGSSFIIPIVKTFLDDAAWGTDF
ncbi:MAG: hypothetical protein SGBAC_010276 [Bacillariaceae sp.]